ncbi:MAG TPA: hypothetical protein VLB47_13415 [Solirubrobacteraceae bacterium]|nr:hypothetical protein [Solirubrobacteraceae bacterium]
MRRTLPFILALAALLLAAAPALADSNQRIYDDCQDNGRIDGRYTQREFQKALNDLPSDLDEYTDCRDVIRRGQLAAAGGGGSGGGAGGGALGGGSGGGTGGAASRDPLATATPQERKAYADAVKAGARPVNLAGEAVRPGAGGLHRLASEGHDLPVPVIALLALVAVALATGAGTLTWNRLRGVRARGAG